MQGLFKLIQTYDNRKKYYLAHNAPEIAQINKRFLLIASSVTVVLYLVLFIMAELIFQDWKPSVFHIGFFPFIFAFACYAYALDRDAKASYRAVMWSCVLFEVLVYALVILVDTVANPETPGSFVELVCMALTALFILPDRFTFGLFLAAEVSYVALVLAIKEPFIASNDIFSVVAGFTFSICFSLLTSSSRLNAYSLRMRFELLSKRDTLSSLFNKRAFTEQVESYLAQTDHVAACSLAFIDIDDFKQLNDRLGHPAGDKVLSYMGRLLGEQFRSNDIIGRFGGDEFLVLLDRFTKPNLLEARFTAINRLFAEHTEETLGEPFHLSMGIVHVERERVTFDALLDQADQALYQAKSQGKNSLVIKPYVTAPQDGAQPGHRLHATPIETEIDG